MTAPAMHFQPGDHAVPIGSAQSVLAVALKNDIAIHHSCGGMGSCTTCRVFVIASKTPLPPRTELECEAAEARGFGENERLSCQLTPLDGLVVRIPEPLDSSFG